MPRPKKILTPGPVATVEGDDLAEFEGDKLPDAVIPNSQELLAEVMLMRPQIKDLKARTATVEEANAEARKAKGPEVFSVEEAHKIHAEAIAKGIRPRAVLTPNGWLVHSEMARTAGSLGGNVLGVGVPVQ
jgi:hypothetical protein